MRISDFLCKVSLLLAVCTLMFVAYGCTTTPCDSLESDFHMFDMDLRATFKNSTEFYKSRIYDKQFMVYRQWEDTLIIGLRARPIIPSSGTDCIIEGFAHWVTSMDVVSDADWDAAHPAGTSLADIIIAKIHYEYGAPSGRIFKPLSKVVFDKALYATMPGVSHGAPYIAYIGMALCFPNPPRPGKHVFTVKVGKSNGDDFEQQSIPVIWD